MNLPIGVRLFLVLMVAFLTNCAGTKPESEPVKNAQPGDPMPGMNEEFDPMSLGDYNFMVKSKEAEPELNIAPTQKPAAVDTTDSNEPESADGFRVQIISTTDEIAAREIRKEAILKQENDVYLIFDSPYYKVRVGNCLTRSEADELQDLLVKKGFLDAWVIRTKVFKNPATGF